MVGFARVHHPNNCLPLNNRNCFGDDGNVAVQTRIFSVQSTDNGIIDSVECDKNGRENFKRWHRLKTQSQTCMINDNTDSNNFYRRRRVNVRIYHGNSNRNKTMQGNGMWWHLRTTLNSCNLSVSVVFCATISLLLLNIDAITVEPQQTFEQQCEPKVFEETPPDPVSMQLMLIFYFSFQ